jgi:hypothetical protein
VLYQCRTSAHKPVQKDRRVGRRHLMKGYTLLSEREEKARHRGHPLSTIMSPLKAEKELTARPHD